MRPDALKSIPSFHRLLNVNTSFSWTMIHLMSCKVHWAMWCRTVNSGKPVHFGFVWIGRKKWREICANEPRPIFCSYCWRCFLFFKYIFIYQQLFVYSAFWNNYLFGILIVQITSLLLLWIVPSVYVVCCVTVQCLLCVSSWERRYAREAMLEHRNHISLWYSILELMLHTSN